MLIEFHNTFHNTTARVRVANEDYRPDPHGGMPEVRLSQHQIRRVQNKLCSNHECKCHNHQNFFATIDNSGLCWGGTIVR